MLNLPGPTSEQPMAHDDQSPGLKQFDDRLRKLRKDAKLDEDAAAPPPSSGLRGYSAGIQVGIELLAGIVGGGLFGYWLDRWLGTWPLMFLLLFFLGAGAGMLNAYRYIRRASDWPDHQGNG
jgi:ATP synthase protein I